MFTLLLVTALAPSQQCWGPALRLPVRQAPPVIVTPAPPAPPADGSWGRHPDGYWWRYKPAAPPAPAEAGCDCGFGCDCGGEPCECAPPAAPAKIAAEDNYGLDTSELGKRGRYTISDGKGRRSVTRERAVESVQAGIPDDGKHMRLLVVGTDAERKAVLDDLERSPALAPWKGRLVVQSRPEDALTREHKVPSGHPSILVQAPNGQVLARNLDGKYQGADALARGLEAAAKRYDPSKDVDLWQPGNAPAPAPGPAPSGGVAWQVWALAALGAAAVFLLFWRPTRADANAG